MNKAEANYEDRAPSLAESCSGCTHFTEPDRCEVVSEPVDPMGTCDYLEPMQATAAPEGASMAPPMMPGPLGG